MIRIQSAISDDDRNACFRIRADVFIAEQNVPAAEEYDAYDATALHLLAWVDGQPAGTARVMLSQDGSTAKIGRVAVQRAQRGSGIGRALLEAIEALPELAGVRCFTLDAQTHALRFYEGLGYVTQGEEFPDAGIAHRHMTKTRVAR